MNLFEGGFRVRACSKSGWKSRDPLDRQITPPGDRWHADMVDALKKQAATQVLLDAVVAKDKKEREAVKRGCGGGGAERGRRW